MKKLLIVFKELSELKSNMVYRDSSSVLFLILSLFNYVDEFNAGNDIGQQVIAS